MLLLHLHYKLKTNMAGVLFFLVFRCFFVWLIILSAAAICLFLSVCIWYCSFHLKRFKGYKLNSSNSLWTLIYTCFIIVINPSLFFFFGQRSILLCFWVSFIIFISRALTVPLVRAFYCCYVWLTFSMCCFSFNQKINKMHLYYFLRSHKVTLILREKV